MLRTDRGLCGQMRHHSRRRAQTCRCCSTRACRSYVLDTGCRDLRAYIRYACSITTGAQLVSSNDIMMKCSTGLQWR
eukprot:scaffold7226_cov387-Prasinococcus_capsulatus_cf.AAC.11